MEKKQFSKSAVKNVIGILQEELKDVRQSIRYNTNDERDTEGRIKKLKAQITEVGKEIVEYERGGKTTNTLRELREMREKDLSHWKEAFKQESKDIRLLKDSLHVLEFAIETLKKEFGQ